MVLSIFKRFQRSKNTDEPNANEVLRIRGGCFQDPSVPRRGKGDSAGAGAGGNAIFVGGGDTSGGGYSGGHHGGHHGGGFGGDGGGGGGGGGGGDGGGGGGGGGGGC